MDSLVGESCGTDSLMGVMCGEFNKCLRFFFPF